MDKRSHAAIVIVQRDLRYQPDIPDFQRGNPRDAVPSEAPLLSAPDGLVTEALGDLERPGVKNDDDNDEGRKTKTKNR